MNWHPLTLALWLTESLSWCVYFGAVWRVLAVLSEWQPSVNSESQLQREHALELVVYQGRWTMGLQIVALVLLIAGISNVWPALVPGAMCGTGVLQAMGPDGWQTIAFHLLTLFGFICWRVVVVIDRADPLSPMALLQARLLLLIAPCLFWSGVTLWRALSAIQGAAPVNCCAAVYGRVAGGWLSSGWLSELSSREWLSAGLIGSMILLGWAARQWRHPESGISRSIFLALPLTAFWACSAEMGLRFGVGPYVYQVLQHPCPWCFFLSEHRYIGIVLFGLPLLVITECAAAMTAAGVARRYPSLSMQANERASRAGLYVLVCTVFLLLIAATPVLLWRSRFGGWID